MLREYNVFKVEIRSPHFSRTLKFFNNMLVILVVPLLRQGLPIQMVLCLSKTGNTSGIKNSMTSRNKIIFNTGLACPIVIPPHYLTISTNLKLQRYFMSNPPIILMSINNWWGTLVRIRRSYQHAQRGQGGPAKSSWYLLRWIFDEWGAYPKEIFAL